MIAIHLGVSDEINFADAPQYLTYTDNLFFYRPPDWFVFEPFSKIMLIGLRALTGDTEHAVAGAHYVISIMFLLGMLAIFPPSQGNWRGLIMMFALYGPQLAFVIVRATPAYMIASVAVLQAVRGQKRAFAFVALATMFHVSAVLALVPIVTLFFKSRFKGLSAALHKPRVLLSMLFLIFFIMGVLGPFILSSTKTLFSNVPFLGKYLVFAVGASDTGSTGNLVSTFAIGHFVLLLAITAFTIGFLLINDAITRNVAIFVIVSYVFYAFIFLAFSPIAAFRQTMFWALTAFSIFPWQRIGWRGIGHAPFLALATGMFLFQFSRVI